MPSRLHTFARPAAVDATSRRQSRSAASPTWVMACWRVWALSAPRCSAASRAYSSVRWRGRSRRACKVGLHAFFGRYVARIMPVESSVGTATGATLAAMRMPALQAACLPACLLACVQVPSRAWARACWAWWPTLSVECCRRLGERCAGGTGFLLQKELASSYRLPVWERSCAANNECASPEASP